VRRTIRSAKRVHGVLLGLALAAAGSPGAAGPASGVALEIVGDATPFAPGIASTAHSEIRLTLSRDGDTALWFSRDRPGGAGGYDIWMSRRIAGVWSEASPVAFNSPSRDFDPAFSADGRFVYFCSDRPGGMGGDDLYRVAVTDAGFGAVEHLGPAVNSTAAEFAPMLAPRGDRLLFSSDRSGGAGGHDLFMAAQAGTGFAPAQRLSGAVNTTANEFDATFLDDGETIVFARAQDFRRDRVDMFVSSPHAGRYHAGERLPSPANSSRYDSYGAMLDWSTPDTVTFSAERAEGQGMDLYRLRYRLRAIAHDAAD
jgi:TolB protein